MEPMQTVGMVILGAFVAGVACDMLLEVGKEWRTRRRFRRLLARTRRW